MNTTQTNVDTLRTRIKRMQTVQDLTVQLGAALELKPLLSKLVMLISELIASQQILVFIIDDEEVGLKFGASNKPLPATINKEILQDSIFSLFNAAGDPEFGPLLKGEIITVGPEVADTSLAARIAQNLQLKSFFGAPLRYKDNLIGLILLVPKDGQTLTEDDRELLNLATVNLAIAVENARQYSKTVEKLKTNMHEMNMLQQIDRELNDTIELNHVFRMALDWALRFSNAHAASLALYDEDQDELRIIAHYGYEVTQDSLDQFDLGERGIIYRVAHSGQTEVIPDVTTDSDYIMIANNIRSQLSVPIMREDRVVAVMTLESRKLNGFRDDHIEFVQKLATRSAVAIDNARLFTETEREREKLSHILRNIADVVIVVGSDDRIMLINQSALSALRLYADKNYVGQPVAEVLENSRLLDIYQRAKQLEEGIIEEIDLPNGRTFHAKAANHEGLGSIIVLQDITPFKEMDRLKSELIATVSHDLKQPLSVMTGYLDLLEMKNDFDEQSGNFVNMIDRSIRNMRQLIDDLLDLAKIESGIDLKLGPVDVKNVLMECIESVTPAANNKSMTIVATIPDNLPPVRGEHARLRQIFDNLISNAVKYTPPEGTVTISAESRGITLRVTVRDNGLGISPEDQAHIFDRFYRVRRPETDSIDGTGLGLAIVKTLVEAHHGKIGLESHLGQGSTFYVTLPTD